MRFCPFCSAENADELAACQSCGRRLPPLPPRRARNAPATGVLLPPRTQPATQPPPLTAPRKASPSVPPPLSPLSPLGGAAQPGVMVTSAGLPPVAPNNASGLRSPAPPIPGGPPPAAPPAGSVPPSGQNTTVPGLAPVVPASGPRVQPSILSASAPAAAAAPANQPPLGDSGARSLAVALSPGPAAQRREPPPAELVDPGAPARRRADAPAAAGKLPPPAGAVAADPPWATGYPRAAGLLDPDTQPSAAPLTVDASRRRDDGIDPPPTRVHRPEALADRPFTPPQVSPVPEIPEPGLVNSARYAIRFAQARWQRRGAIRALGADIKKDTDALDQVLGALGGVARTAKVDGRVFFGENAAINSAEDRVAQLGREHSDVDTRKLEENAKFVDIERERNAKLAEAERLLDEAQKELAGLESQRRGMRDKRKELERRQKTYLKAAEETDRQTGSAELGDTRQELRRTAEQHRREAAAIEPERQDLDRKLGAIERPIAEATARLDAAKAELDAAKRSLSDAREGHNHRLAELDAEQKRKSREIAQAEAEIARRLVTLGTLVNLNRIDDPQFTELYGRIDRLRGAITARTTEIEKLTAEREAYDRGNLVRGIATLGGAVIAFIALIVILRLLLVH